MFRGLFLLVSLIASLATVVPAEAATPRFRTAALDGRVLTIRVTAPLRPGRLDPYPFRVTFNGGRVGVIRADAVANRIVLRLRLRAHADDEVAVRFARAGGKIAPRDRLGRRVAPFDRAVSVHSAPAGCTPTLRTPPKASPTGYGLAPDLSAPRRTPATLRAVALFIDFEDAPGDVPPPVFEGDMFRRAQQWYRETSYGRFELAIDRVERWIRLPGSKSRFAGPHVSQELIAAAVTAADPDVDFSRYSLLYLVGSRGSNLETYASPAPFDRPLSPGSAVRHTVVLGWRILKSEEATGLVVHETGHTLGLIDLYADWRTGARRLDVYAGFWDPMSMTESEAGFIAWHRWFLGWLDSGQLRCHRSGTSEYHLTPLDAPGGPKAVVVALDERRALVIESRRRVGFDATLCDEGVLVYLVDTNALTGIFAGPIRVQPGGSGDDPATVARCGLLYDAAFGLHGGKHTRFVGFGLTVDVLAGSPVDGYRIRVAL